MDSQISKRGKNTSMKLSFVEGGNKVTLVCQLVISQSLSMGEPSNQNAVDALAAEVDHQLQEMQSAISAATPDFSIDDIPEEAQQNVLFDSLSGRGQMVLATGFTEGEVQGFYQMLWPHCVTVQQAGA